MIGRLTGMLAECAPGRALIDVAGVGYEVQIPLSTFYELPQPGSGVSVQLHIHTHVREDVLQLFGFWAAGERRAFERLISISGVGPRMALAFLSGIGVQELVVAVEQEDRARLQKIPGVGRKTAERVLLELKDRLQVEDPPQATPQRPTDSPSIRSDAISALLNLGYARDTALRAVDAAIADQEPTAALETVLRSALRRLVGGA